MAQNIKNTIVYNVVIKHVESHKSVTIGFTDKVKAKQIQFFIRASNNNINTDYGGCVDVIAFDIHIEVTREKDIHAYTLNDKTYDDIINLDTDEDTDGDEFFINYFIDNNHYDTYVEDEYVIKFQLPTAFIFNFSRLIAKDNGCDGLTNTITLE